MMPQTRVMKELKAHKHRHLVNFDFQHHNLMYLFNRLDVCMANPRFVNHFVDRIEGEIRKDRAAKE